jgi:hypothetical protein
VRIHAVCPSSRRTLRSQECHQECSPAATLPGPERGPALALKDSDSLPLTSSAGPPSSLLTQPHRDTHRTVYHISEPQFDPPDASATGLIVNPFPGPVARPLAPTTGLLEQGLEVGLRRLQSIFVTLVAFCSKSLNSPRHVLPSSPPQDHLSSCVLRQRVIASGTSATFPKSVAAARRMHKCRISPRAAATGARERESQPRASTPTSEANGETSTWRKS